MDTRLAFQTEPFAFPSEPADEFDEVLSRASDLVSIPSRRSRQGVTFPPHPRNYHHVLGQGVPVRLRSFSSRELEDQEIIGDDTRRKVDGRNVPFRWMCSLKTRFRDPDSVNAVDFDAGTGVLVDAQYVLTAAHNVFAEITGSRGTKARRKALMITVYPGRNGETGFPFGNVQAADFRYLKAYEKDLDVRLDFALIKLKADIGNQKFKILGNQPLGWWGSKNWGAGTVIRPPNRDSLQDKVVNVSGYPNDKNHEQYVAFDVVTNANPTVRGAKVPELITYLADTKVGQSGAPVWLYLKSKERCLVAIHNGTCPDALDGCKPSSGSKPTSNMGVIITTAVLDQIAAWKKEM